MSDSAIVSRFNARPGASELARDAEESICDDVGCFGWLRGVRERAIMLELRKKNGNILAISYSWIERIEFDPSEGIALIVSGARIRMQGRHLNGPPGARARLFDGLARHRVPWIQEVDGTQPFAPEGDSCAVERLTW